MKRWIKRLLILGIIAVLTIFFGSVVFLLLSYAFSFGGTLMNWLSVAMKWLAKLVDIFGFTGILTAQANSEIITNSIENLKILIGG